MGKRLKGYPLPQVQVPPVILTIVEEKYDLIDKSKFPEGEWTTEPDMVKLIDDKLYPYLIRRGPDSLGHLCAYAGVFEPSPLWEKDYDNIQSFDVELTFAGKWFDMSPLVWWFGWDHAHLGDLIPGMVRFSGSFSGRFNSETYKNIAYVIREMEKVSKQLRQIEYDTRNRHTS